MSIKLIWPSKDDMCTWAHTNETLIFELGQLRHRIETIVLAHSQCHVLRPMIVFEISYTYTFHVHTRRKFESLLEQYCTNYSVFAGIVPNAACCQICVPG